MILRTLLRAVRTMDNPADMINATLEELIKEHILLFLLVFPIPYFARTSALGHKWAHACKKPFVKKSQENNASIVFLALFYY